MQSTLSVNSLMGIDSGHRWAGNIKLNSKQYEEGKCKLFTNIKRMIYTG